MTRSPSRRDAVGSPRFRVEGDDVITPIAATIRSARAIVPVPISNVPTERMAQLVGFFQRNPGWIRTQSIGDVLRGWLANVPVLGEVARWLEPVDVGFGQAIRDQTAWQITTRRQPDNPWWLRMNQGLVQDPLTAELAIRTGRLTDLQTEGQRAWAEYILRGDVAKLMLRIDPRAKEWVAADGTRQSIALSDAWKGVGWLDRLLTEQLLQPWIRAALWKAHRETLQDGRPNALEQGRAMNRRAPREMAFSSAWATFIGYWSWLNPPVMGNQSALAQLSILPPDHPIDGRQQSLPMRIFEWFITMLDGDYEREFSRPAALRDSALAASATSSAMASAQKP